MFRRLLLFAVLCACALAQKKSGEKIEPVQMDFTVTGSGGEFVPGLTAADFEISQESKRLKVVKAVPVPSPSARTMVVVVDDLGLSLDGLNMVQRALRKFVAEQVQPGDRISLIRTGVHTGRSQLFTSDRAQLVAAIEGLNYNHLRDAGAKSLNTFLSGTLLQLRFTMEALRKTPARTAVVLLSERFTPPSGTDLETLAAAEYSAGRIADFASQAMAVFYAVRVQPSPNAAPPAARIETGLASMVADTGGLWIDDGPDLAAALSRVIADQSQHYLATFEPAVSAFDYTMGRGRSDRFPHLSVKVSRPGVQVRARSAVYAAPDSDALPGFNFASDDADEEAAASSPFEGGDIAIRSTPLFYNSTTEGRYVEVMLHIEGKSLTFTKGLNGEYRTVIRVESVAFDSTGQTAGEVNRGLSYALPEESYRLMLAEGFLYSQRLPLRRPGAFQLRTAVRDEATGRTGSAGEYLEIPDVAKGELAASGLVIRSSRATAAEQAAEVRERIAVRTFPPGSKLSYNYHVYNLSSDASKKSRIELQMRLFRNGVQVFAGAPNIVPFEYSPQKTHTISGTLGINSEMAPGRFVLQVTTTDLVSEKPRSVTQFIDLEVRP